MPNTMRVNAHTHLELSWAAALCPSQPVPFTDWLYRFVKRNRLNRLSPDGEARQQAGIEAGISQLIDSGTTHIGDITQSGLSIEPLLASGLAGVVYIEIIGLEEGVADFMFQRAVQLLDTYRPQERNGMRIGFTLHALYSTPLEAFEKVARFCMLEEVPLAIHVAESPAETEALVHGRGPLYELPRRIVGAEAQRPLVTGRPPLTTLAELGVLEAKPLLIHMVEVSEAELDLVAVSGAPVAHCPRSNILLHCGRMPLEKMVARGIPVALGTDSLASSPSLDVREEAAAAAQLHVGQLTDGMIEKLLLNVDVFTP